MGGLLTPVPFDIETTGLGRADEVTVVGFELELGCRLFCQHSGRTPAGENHPRWKGGTEGYQYYGPEWPRQREKALERDNYECVDCGMTSAEHNSEYDTGLHVHHKRPIREFIDSDALTRSEGNRLANLVTLCYDCHGKWESLPVQLQRDERE